jgi:hypothetical protein
MRCEYSSVSHPFRRKKLTCTPRIGNLRTAALVRMICVDLLPELTLTHPFAPRLAWTDQVSDSSKIRLNFIFDL